MRMCGKQFRQKKLAEIWYEVSKSFYFHTLSIFCSTRWWNKWRWGENGDKNIEIEDGEIQVEE